MVKILVPFDGMYYEARIDKGFLREIAQSIYADPSRFASLIASGEGPYGPAEFVQYGVTQSLGASEAKGSVKGNLVDNLAAFFAEAEDLARREKVPNVLVGSLNLVGGNRCCIEGLVQLLKDAE